MADWGHWVIGYVNGILHNKTHPMKTSILVLATVILQATAIAQTPIIFQPGPGQNDGSDMGTLNAGMDATVNQSTPETNYGDASAVVSLPPSNCNETEVESYIRFDISLLPDVVDSVFLNFYHLPQTNYCYSNCDAYWNFAPLTEEWGENTVNWNNRLDYGEPYGASIHFTFPDTGGWHRYNITSLYNDWKSGAVYNYGIAIYSTTEGCNNAAIMFYAASSDDTTAGGLHRPYLEVYETPNAVQTNIKNKLNAKVYPNPAKDDVTISYSLFEPSPIGLRVEGLDGRIWFLQAAMEMEKGNHKKTISIAQLVSGIYMLIMETPNGILRERFVVP